MSEIVRFSDVTSMLLALRPDEPVLCVRAEVLRARARSFLDGLPGRVLYAMKCNPEPFVLRVLHQAGIRDFDTASLAEMAWIHDLLPAARCYFHHPVKSRRAIPAAYRDHGVRHFVVDHESELAKLLDGLDARDIAIHVRVKTPPCESAIHLAAKFGAEPEAAVELLRRVAGLGLGTGLAFHVGSQCRAPEAYADAIALSGQVAVAADVRPGYLNVGGGFPIAYPPAPPPGLEAYLATIREAFAAEAAFAETELIAEPGRALVGEAASLIVRVEMRRGRAIYINDGLYGALMDLRLTPGLNPPVALRRPGGPAPSSERMDFTVYGPTCDSLDVLPLPWRLPRDLAEGDWIEVGQMGAYASAFATNFNGARREILVAVADAPLTALAA